MKTIRYLCSVINKKIAMEKFKFQGTDEMEEAVTKAASIIADEFFRQNGKSEIAEDHDDEWYVLQESLIASMYEAVGSVTKDF